MFSKDWKEIRDDVWYRISNNDRKSTHPDISLPSIYLYEADHLPSESESKLKE
jgi:hypothetical protein